MSTDTLSGAPWLAAAETRTLISTLEAVRADCMRFVGGCVRNTLMGRAVDDIDIATQLVPDEVIAALHDAGLRAVPTGVEHGTVTAIVNHVPFEITTLRRDVETDGRRAVVAFTQDWAQDAQRRDFRLNALYAEPDGTLHDPTQGGLEDARAGRVIFIGDADERLREDYLRILRFFRFNAWYGAQIDADGLDACVRHRDGLARIAAERKWKELKRLLEAPSPAASVGAMEDSGVLDAVLPGAHADHLRALELVEAASGVMPDPLVRLMTMVPRRKSGCAEIASALRLSNAEGARLAAWSDPALGKVARLSGHGLREALYRHGNRAMIDCALVEAAVGGEIDRASDLLAAAAEWTRPDFPLGGDDALAAGLSGPAIGEALSRLEAEWIASDFSLEHDALLERLKR